MASTTKRIVCLANSRKRMGRCIAGIELRDDEPDGWIRLVSDGDSGAVSEEDRRFLDGADPQVLDIIDIPVKGRQPHPHQLENWLIDSAYYWTKVGCFQKSRLPDLLGKVYTLWDTGFQSRLGFNDRIPESYQTGIDHSLRLVELSELELEVFRDDGQSGTQKRRLRGTFRHARVRYTLSVTDPHMERRYLARPDGIYRVGPCFITVSLGDEFKGFCYKLIAAVIESEE